MAETFRAHVQAQLYTWDGEIEAYQGDISSVYVEPAAALHYLLNERSHWLVVLVLTEVFSLRREDGASKYTLDVRKPPRAQRIILFHPSYWKNIAEDPNRPILALNAKACSRGMVQQINLLSAGHHDCIIHSKSTPTR